MLLRKFTDNIGYHNLAEGCDSFFSAVGDPREFEALGCGKIILPVQTHSARVVCVPAESDLQGVDGVVTVRRGLLIGVRTADCLPLLMADAGAGVVAAVHCGWRGTVASIAREGVRLMESLGAVPSRIHAVFGPHICAECFEVGEEVACQFPDRAVIRRAGCKPRVSLSRAVELQLRACGVGEIADLGICSKESAAWCSVRRCGRHFPLRSISAVRCG